MINTNIVYLNQINSVQSNISVNFQMRMEIKIALWFVLKNKKKDDSSMTILNLNEERTKVECYNLIYYLKLNYSVPYII